MTFADLALAVAVALLGPLGALSPRFGAPVVVGELIAGVIFGPMLLNLLDPGQSTFAFLAQVGFALVMFVAGSHVPIRNPQLRRALRPGLVRAVLGGAAAVPVAWALATAFGTGHAAVYAVLMASSSAALVLPIIDGRKLGGVHVLELLPQVAVADAACIVALPLAVQPARAARAGLGAVEVLLAAGVLFLALREVERRGWRKRMHHLSEKRKFALELRVHLALLFGLAAIAVAGHVSVMLAGFAFGVAVAAIGEPRRLARQLFAVTDGFFAPLFFVWLGTSLDLRALGSRPGLILLGICLGLGAGLAHLAGRITGQPLPFGLMAATQLGVPVAAATLGTQLNVLQAGEPAALLLGALVTIAVTSAVAPLAARLSPSGPAVRGDAGGAAAAGASAAPDSSGAPGVPSAQRLAGRDDA